MDRLIIGSNLTRLKRDNNALRDALARESARATAALQRAEFAEAQLRVFARILSNGRPPAPPTSGPCHILLANGQPVLRRS